MNTPSKEALDAAENVQDYWGFPRRATIDLATIIDRHFEPLRAEMVQLTVDRDNWKIRAEEMDGYKADCMELRQRAEQAEQKARDWETAANLYQLDFQTEAARAEQAEARVKELEAACAELVTDGNAITLAANLARQSERVKELEALAQTQMAKLEEIHALRASVDSAREKEAQT